jgi:hypothetical protein
MSAYIDAPLVYSTFSWTGFLVELSRLAYFFHFVGQWARFYLTNQKGRMYYVLSLLLGLRVVVVIDYIFSLARTAHR